MYQGEIRNIKNSIDKYIETFGVSLPLIMVKDNVTESQIIDRMEKAIEEEVEIPTASFIYYKELSDEVV